MAVNCCVVPSGSVGIAGVTAMETRTAGVTVTVVEPVIVPDVAVTVVLPKAALLAMPWLFTEAIPEFALFQVAVAVKSRVPPSLYVPVANKGRLVPKANDGVAGVTAIETRTGCPTVSEAEAMIEPAAAVIVAVPTAAPVAKPPALIVAVEEDELQLTALVTSCTLPSL